MAWISLAIFACFQVNHNLIPPVGGSTLRSAFCNSQGELIAFARMDGAPISSIRIAANKAWTAARERKPTKEIGQKVRHPEKGHDIAYYGDPKFVGWGGGIPVWKNGDVVGVVAVSGLSSNEDISLASLGAELIAGHDGDHL